VEIHAEIHADSAYRSAEQEIRLIETGHVSQINEKGSRAHPLSDEQKIVNRTKSKIRSRVEHVFGGDDQRDGRHLHPHHWMRTGASSNWVVEPDYHISVWRF
jgi:IS5 family transposase